MRGRVITAGLFLSAACLAGYLTYLGFTQGSAPPGCGSGSGCGEVLGSRWSSLFGIPVSFPAVVAYALAAGLLFVNKAHRVIVFLCAALLTGAVWFVILQLVILRAVCPYCMVDHALGAAACILALKRMPFSRTAFATGTAAGFLFIAAQFFQPDTHFSLDLPQGVNVDQQVNGRRYVTLLEGAFAFEVADEPHFGSAEAERIVLLAVDYACPHCKKLHALALEQLEAHPDELCVVILPTPIHPSCNHAMTQAPDRFEHSCELALLSLAVHAADPVLWETFDQWLFEDFKPKHPDEAKRKAAELLGRLPDMDTVKEKLDRNINLFAAMPVENENARRVPVTWWVHQPPFIGPLHDGGLLWERAKPTP